MCQKSVWPCCLAAFDSFTEEPSDDPEGAHALQKHGYLHILQNTPLALSVEHVILFFLTKNMGSCCKLQHA